MAVPKIRFPEFTDPWEDYTFGDLYSERNERGNDSLPILSVSIHSGVSNGEMDAEELGKNVKRSEDKTLYKHVHPGDLVFNMMRAWQGAIGVTKNEGMISPAYISAIPNNLVYAPFMDYLVQRPELIVQINNLSYGVTDFRKRLYWDSFVKVKCKLPSYEEQKKIAAILEKIDGLIEMQQKRADDINALKKSMLQKLFPAEGKNIPEIRFPGFTNAWEQRKCGELCDEFQSGKGIKAADIHEIGSYPVYGGNGLRGYSDTYNHDGEYALVGRQGALCGNMNWSTGKAYFTEHAVAVHANSRNDTKFLFYLLDRMNLGQYSDQSAQPGLAVNKLVRLDAMVPGLEEQKKIAAMFTKLDNAITLHQHKLDNLTRLKKALLQQMFV